MGNLIIFLVVGVFILAVLQAIWPVLLAVAAIAVAGGLAVGFWNYWGHHSHVKAAKRAAIEARAEQQHQKIMSGDEVAGTYGDYLPEELDRPTANTVPNPPPRGDAARPRGKAARPTKLVFDTGKLEVDFVDRMFLYTDSKEAERKASFPKGQDGHGRQRDPNLDDLARLLASVRGWAKAGGENEWWHLTFNERTTMDEMHGIEMSDSFTLELTGQNPYTDFSSYLSLRGKGPLKGYAAEKGKEEEQVSYGFVQFAELKYLYDIVNDGLKDAHEMGYFGNPDAMFMRVIYRSTGDNEFEIRMPCEYERPEDWTPEWESPT